MPIMLEDVKVLTDILEKGLPQLDFAIPEHFAVGDMLLEMVNIVGARYVYEETIMKKAICKKVCGGCGKEFEVRPRREQAEDFCSRVCHELWLSENIPFQKERIRIKGLVLSLGDQKIYVGKSG